MTQELPDAAARQEIAGRLDRTLFVEAGAGSGKTQSLVDRVVATVLSPAQAVPLRHVAAVTFTEKAGAELRDRLRVAFESELVAAEPGSDRADRATEALDDLDAAAIGTLHSFAERILGEHPVEAGLPPLIEVRDEVASGVAFDDRWTVGWRNGARRRPRSASSSNVTGNVHGRRIPTHALTSYELKNYRRELEHSLKTIPEPTQVRELLQQRLTEVLAEQDSRSRPRRQRNRHRQWTSRQMMPADARSAV
jgi:ATP-dependent exoDNAse (exonuclease V) beta subunit